MKRIVGVFLALAAASSLHAAEIAGTVRDPSGDTAITGTVRDASGDTATVATDAAWLAAIGDSVEIFFKIPGADEEISVATGTVTAVDAKLAKIKVVNATGTIEKDQLARIKPGPGSPPKTPTVSASPTLTPPETVETTSSVTGDWVGPGPDGNHSFSFKDDGTFLWIIKAKDVTETMRGKYLLDLILQPNRIDLFEIDPPGERGDAMSGVFELQADGHLRVDCSVGHQEKPSQGFTDGAVVFSKATSPIVPPPEKKGAGSSIVGDWVGNFPEGNAEDGKLSFGFREDGTLLWVVEGPQYAMSTLAKYRIDPSTQPHGIELFDIEESDLKGQTGRGIFELQSDGRLKLDFAKGPEAPPLKEFTKETVVLSKATSPIVRSNKPAAPTPTPPAPDEIMVNAAVQRYDRGDYAGAMEGLEKALALNPQNARAIYYRGLCFYSKKEWPAAGADFEKAMELDPSMKLQDMINSTKVVFPADELVKEGDELVERTDYDGAIEAYTKAIALNPKNKWAFYGRGNCFFHKKDRSAAIADHETVLALDPDMKKVLDSAKTAREFQEKLEREKQTPTPTPTRAETKRKP